MLSQGKMNEHLFIKVIVYLLFSFPKKKKISAKQDIASTEISYQKSLSTEGFLLEEK